MVFNSVLGLTENMTKGKMNYYQLCCISTILALHLKLKQRLMVIPAGNKTTNLRLSHQQACAVLAYKEFISSAGIRLESYPSVVFMDIATQLDKQLMP